MPENEAVEEIRRLLRKFDERARRDEAKKRERGLSLLSEFCTQSAVLIFVFGNLDVWLKNFDGSLADAGVKPEQVAWHIAAVFGLTFVFGIVGYLIDKWGYE